MIEPKGQDHYCQFCAKALVYKWDLNSFNEFFNPQVEIKVQHENMLSPSISFVHNALVYVYVTKVKLKF